MERRFPPLDTSDLWWQEKEDGSRHDRRNEQDYLELLDWDSQDLSANPDVRRGLSWKEWEEWLGETTAGWRELPKGVQREKQCLRHSSYTLTRINKYTLEGKLELIRVYSSPIPSQALKNILESSQKQTR